MNSSNTGGKNASATTSSASPNQKPATSNAPRMLTPSEIESLKKHKAQVQDAVRRFLRQKAEQQAAAAVTALS